MKANGLISPGSPHECLDLNTVIKLIGRPPQEGPSSTSFPIYHREPANSPKGVL